MPAPEDPAWTAALDQAHADGRQRFPAIGLERAAFEAHARRLAVPAPLLGRHGADLYLAAGCARGDAAAVALFETLQMPVALESLGRLRLPEDLREEASQLVRIRILAGPEPKIALYAATGPLGAWVRVAAMRVGLNLLDSLRVPAQSTLLTDSFDRFLAREGGPEADAARRLDRATFQGALERSLERLSPRDKTILRMHFVDGLGIDAIGTMYRVHRATAARWLAGIRGQVFTDLRRDLALDLRAGSSDLRSLVSLFGNDLRLSLDRILPAEQIPGERPPAA